MFKNSLFFWGHMPESLHFISSNSILGRNPFTVGSNIFCMSLKILAKASLISVIFHHLDVPYTTWPFFCEFVVNTFVLTTWPLGILLQCTLRCGITESNGNEAKSLGTELRGCLLQSLPGGNLWHRENSRWLWSDRPGVPTYRIRTCRNPKDRLRPHPLCYFPDKETESQRG